MRIPAAMLFLAAGVLLPVLAETPTSAEIRAKAREAYEAQRWTEALAAYQQLLWESTDADDRTEATGRMREIDRRLHASPAPVPVPAPPPQPPAPEVSPEPPAGSMPETEAIEPIPPPPPEPPAPVTGSWVDPESSVSVLLADLASGVSRDRVLARQALMKRDPAAVLEALRTADQGRLPATARAEFSWLHGVLGNASAEAVLTGRLEDPNPRVREEASRALGRIKAVGAAPKLKDLLKDGEIPVQEAAAIALGRLGDAAAAGFLCAILDDMRQPVTLRAACAESLGLLEPSRGRASLVGTLRKDPGASVRRAALEALRRMTGLDRCYDPDASQSAREAATLSWEEWLAEQGAGGQ